MMTEFIFDRDLIMSPNAYRALTIAAVANPNEIKFIDEIVPNKVVLVVFSDGTKEKMVLKDPDVFSREDCLYIALAKKLYKETLTYEGLEYVTPKLKYVKEYASIVKAGLKLWKKIDKEKEELAKIENIKARRKQKKIRYKARKKAREKENLINERDKLSNLLETIVKELKNKEE